MLVAYESFFLGCRNGYSVHQQGCRGVVVERARESENYHRRNGYLEKARTIAAPLSECEYREPTQTTLQEPATAVALSRNPVDGATYPLPVEHPYAGSARWQYPQELRQKPTQCAS